MTKSSKYSKGRGRYHKAIDPTGESEGSGSSGQIENEITVSEDSSIPPMTKCIQFNKKNQDAFDIPAQVLPLSNMSSFERKDLINRLTVELEQVRGLQKKVELQRSNAFALSSSSDILCFNREKGSKVDTLKKSKTLTSGLKKKNAPGHKGRGWNNDSAGKFEPAPQVSVIQTSSSTANAILMKQCEALLKRLMTHQYGWVFNTPVDVVKLNLPDYFTIIKHPMDLGTVNNKIASGVYSSPLEFVADVRLTLKNAMTYNPPENDVHIMADTLSKYLEVRWKSIEKKLPKADDVPLLTKLDVTEDSETAKQMPTSKRMKINSVAPKTEIKLESAKPLITAEEKHRLGRELESLIGEVPMKIIDFLREHSSNGRECEDEIEIDIDDLSDDTLFTLRKLLDDYLQEKKRKHENTEPCEIELMNESGPSNSSIQPCKDNDLADEEVDIGGNEPPVSSYSPVAIVKDITHRSMQSVNPGSISDSDSSSTSDNESENNKSPQSGVSENMGSLPKGDENTRIIDPPDKTEAVDGLNQLECAVQPMQCSVNSDCQQHGESAPNQSLEPSSKLYRAAVLKNRFADTILKAREKALAQGEKKDPDKLRMEKEKLEIERQKGKARLEAEAKAAEAARKLAEAEAATKARRKRELEREAARQALLQMEKTVEINESSRFLEDLEMLRAATVEQLPSSVDETSPDHSQDGLGSFKFVGSNPLERLGLYMKEDDDEEEGEGEAPCIPNPGNDVEEGEIH